MTRQQLFEVVLGAVEIARIQGVLQARHCEVVGMLPKRPCFPSVWYERCFDIVLGDPQRVARKMLLHHMVPECRPCVDDRSCAVMSFEAREEDLEVLVHVSRDRSIYPFDVDYRRQIAWNQLYIANEPVGLLLGIVISFEEMIGSSDKTELTELAEAAGKVRIQVI